MAIKIFRPVTVVSRAGGWVEAVGESSFEEAVDPQEPLAHDDDSSYARHTTSTGTKTLGLQHGLDFAENILSIQGLSVNARMRRATAGAGDFTMSVNLGATSKTSGTLSNASTSYADFNYDILSNRPGGGAWSALDLRDPTLSWSIDVASAPSSEGRLTSCWLEGDVTVAGIKLGNMTRVATRRLRLLSRPLPILKVEASAEWLKAEIGSIVPVTHYMIPGVGSGLKLHEQRPYILTDVNHDPTSLLSGNPTCRLTLVDMRQFVLGLWVTDVSMQAFNTQLDGIAALDTGGKEEFQRPGSVYIEDNGEVIEVPDGIPARTTKGLLMQDAGTSQTDNSNFNLGIDSGEWTLAGEGSNGSALDDDTTNLFWDSTLTAQSLKMTAGDPLGGTDLGISQVSSSISRNSSWFAISVTHKDDSGDALGVVLQRSNDSQYYIASSSTWTGSYTVNRLPVVADPTRHDIRVFPVTFLADPTITYSIVTEAAAAQVNHVYDVQFENHGYPTSRIPTGTSGGTRNADSLLRTNFTNAPSWYHERVTAFAEIEPLWGGANLFPTAQRTTIYYVEWDTNNSEWLYYSNGEFVYEVRIGGTLKEAKITPAATVQAGDLIKVACRRTSSVGELGLDAFRSDIFVDGVKGSGTIGTGVVHTAGPPGVPSNLFIGSNGRTGDAQPLDGYIRYRYITPQALSDNEIARLP